jgi:hypothetical protein
MHVRRIANFKIMDLHPARHYLALNDDALRREKITP